MPEWNSHPNAMLEKVVYLKTLDADAQELQAKWDKERVDPLFVIDLPSIKKRMMKYNWFLIGFLSGNVVAYTILYWYLTRMGMSFEVFSR